MHPPAPGCWYQPGDKCSAPLKTKAVIEANRWGCLSCGSFTLFHFFPGGLMKWQGGKSLPCFSYCPAINTVPKSRCGDLTHLSGRDMFLCVTWCCVSSASPEVGIYSTLLSLQGTCGHLQHEHMGPEAIWQAHTEKTRYLCTVKHHSS